MTASFLTLFNAIIIVMVIFKVPIKSIRSPKVLFPIFDVKIEF